MNTPGLLSARAIAKRTTANATTTRPLTVRPVRRSTAASTASGHRSLEGAGRVGELLTQTSWHLDAIDDALRDLLDLLLTQQRVSGEDHPMCEHRHGERLHVVGQHGVTSLRRRPHP